MYWLSMFKIGQNVVSVWLCTCKCSFCMWLCPPASLPEGPFEGRPSWCPGRPLSCMAWRRSAPWTSPGRQRGPPSLSGWSSRAGWFEADGRRWSKQILYHIDYLAAAQLVVQKKSNHCYPYLIIGWWGGTNPQGYLGLDPRCGSGPGGH